jgi:RNA polymerase sigma factor (sigma-70 family)
MARSRPQAFVEDGARRRLIPIGAGSDELAFPKTVPGTSTISHWSSSRSRGVEHCVLYPLRGERVEVGFGGAAWEVFPCVRSDSNRPPHFDRLLKFLQRKGRSREDAEDLIQEAMLRLHLYAAGDVVENQEAFLRRTVQNLAIDRYRRDRFGSQLEVPIEDVDRLSPLIAPNPTPEQVLEHQQQLDDLCRLLDAVNPRTREIYFAHRSGYSYAEISTQMGIAEITIKRHMARALAILMKQGLTD